MEKEIKVAKTENEAAKNSLQSMIDDCGHECMFSMATDFRQLLAALNENPEELKISLQYAIDTIEGEMIGLDICPECGGRLFLDNNYDLACFNCGKVEV